MWSPFFWLPLPHLNQRVIARAIPVKYNWLVLWTFAVPDIFCGERRRLENIDRCTTKQRPSSCHRQRGIALATSFARSVGIATVCWSANLWCICAKKAKRRPSKRMVFFLAPLVGLEPTTCGLTVRRSTDWAKEECLCSRYLFSRPVTRQLSSAYMCLTSVFGMGTGGPTWQSTRTRMDGFDPSFICRNADAF